MRKIALLIVLLINIAFSLTVPSLTTGTPSAGVRVNRQLKNINYSLYLPTDYTADKQFPVIFELPPNRVDGYFSGDIDSICLGYGLTTGKNFIWVGAPFLNTAGTAVQTYWWGDGSGIGQPFDSTLSFWKAIVHDIATNYHADTTKIILAGFSRGSIATSYCGLSNDNIAGYWAGIFNFAHMDYVTGYKSRLARTNNRKTWVSVGSLDSTAFATTDSGLASLSQLNYPTNYYRIPSYAHDPHWILSDTGYIPQIARAWVQNIVSGTIPTIDTISISKLKFDGTFSLPVDSISNGQVSNPSYTSVYYTPTNTWKVSGEYSINIYINNITFPFTYYITSFSGGGGNNRWLTFKRAFKGAWR